MFELKFLPVNNGSHKHKFYLVSRCSHPLICHISITVNKNLLNIQYLVTQYWFINRSILGLFISDEKSGSCSIHLLKTGGSG